MKYLLLHFIGILLYFPVVAVLFLYLLMKPNQMITFYLGMNAIADILDRDKKLPE